MKRTFKKGFLLLLAAATALASCKRETGQESASIPEGEGRLSVSLVTGSETKATSDNTMLEAECTINDLQLLVFDDDGRLQRYFAYGESSVADNGKSSASVDTSFTVPVGQKTVCALVNGPDVSDIGYLSDLNAIELSLTEYNDVSHLMHYATGTCTVKQGQTANCPLKVKRLVSRIHIASITNSLPPYYGEIRVKRTFLTNVVNWANLAMDKEYDSRSLVYGRCSASDPSTILPASGDVTSALYDYVWYSGIQVERNNTTTPSELTSCYFYCYPHSCTDFSDHEGSTTIEDQATCLVLVCEILGRDYYYPVSLGALEANTAYDFYLTINSLGVDDPSTPVELGSLTVTVSFGGWVAGTAIIETI